MIVFSYVHVGLTHHIISKKLTYFFYESHFAQINDCFFGDIIDKGYYVTILLLEEQYRETKNALKNIIFLGVNCNMEYVYKVSTNKIL